MAQHGIREEASSLLTLCSAAPCLCASALSHALRQQLQQLEAEEAAWLELKQAYSHPHTPVYEPHTLQRIEQSSAPCNHIPWQEPEAAGSGGAAGKQQSSWPPGGEGGAAALPSGCTKQHSCAQQPPPEREQLGIEGTAAAQAPAGGFAGSPSVLPAGDGKASTGTLEQAKAQAAAQLSAQVGDNGSSPVYLHSQCKDQTVHHHEEKQSSKVPAVLPIILSHEKQTGSNENVMLSRRGVIHAWVAIGSGLGPWLWSPKAFLASWLL